MNSEMFEDHGTLEYTLIESEPIIGFNLWGETRICLPQLLRFVLSDFDINVIDRAVTDLQINCFQSNSEQINLLHVNNIVPKEIVRCGLIRKSDAERLCKYLLQPNQNFDGVTVTKTFLNHQCIEVIHTCFGEQRGTLYPMLYNSPDAKCIKCLTCDNFFKTFEFVGHTHKLDEVSNTFHWGFDSNNWRLLLQIFGSNDKVLMVDLNEAKSMLDKVKTLFYEEEIKKINKSGLNIVWRPSRRFKLPSPPKKTLISNKPSHLKDGPVEFYKKSNNRGLNSSQLNLINSQQCAPNVYLDQQDNFISTGSVIDDDDIEEYEESLDKSLKNNEDIAMNVALQIKREAMPKDPICLGTISTFLNKKDFKLNIQSSSQSTSKPLKPNCSPVVVAQANASIPPQFLMLEALWSQLFRDIIQLTHLIQFNTNDERNRLVGQLIRCQDVFRSQWTDLAEENQSLQEKLLQEQRRRQDIEIIRDKMAISLKELTVEKENLTEIIKQLESKCEQLRCDNEDNTNSSSKTSSCCDEEYNCDGRDPQLNIVMDSETFRMNRMKLKRELDYDNEVNVSRKKQIRLDDESEGEYSMSTSCDEEST